MDDLFIFSSLRKHIHKIVTEYLCHRWSLICSVCRNHISALCWSMTFHRDCNKGNMSRATNLAAKAYPSRAHEVTSDFSGVLFAQSIVLCVVFCRSLFVLLFFIFWSLHCLSFSTYGFWLPLWYLRFTVSHYPCGILDLRFLITFVVS